MKTLRIVLVTLFAFTVALVLAAPSLLGFSVWRLGDAVAVATGMGAKLGCSAYFASGFTEPQVTEDLASFSPVTRLLKLEYGERRVAASLLGLAPASATYRPGLGCTLDIGDTAPLDRLSVMQAPPVDDAWPAGNRVEARIPGLQRQLDELLAEDGRRGLQTRALLVVRDGRIAAESYGEGIGPETPLLGFSMGKSVVAIMLGRMEMLGLLPSAAQQAQQPLFPQWVGDARGDIGLQHLLQMTSGLLWDETYAPGSDSTKILFQVHSASEVALTSGQAHPPGRQFYYSSGTTNLLSRYLHDRLGGGQAQLDFFSREILQPLGMRDTIFEPDPSGVFVGSSYIYASGRDWARLGLLMLDRGAINGRQLLDETWVDRAIAANASDNDQRYGYQFWLNGGAGALRWPELPADAYAMQGNRGQVVMVIPSARTVLVRLGWSSASYPVGAAFARLLASGS